MAGVPWLADRRITFDIIGRVCLWSFFQHYTKCPEVEWVTRQQRHLYLGQRAALLGEFFVYLFVGLFTHGLVGCLAMTKASFLSWLKRRRVSDTWLDTRSWTEVELAGKKRAKRAKRAKMAWEGAISLLGSTTKTLEHYETRQIETLSLQGAL